MPPLLFFFCSRWDTTYGHRNAHRTFWAHTCYLTMNLHVRMDLHLVMTYLRNEPAAVTKKIVKKMYWKLWTQNKKHVTVVPHKCFPHQGILANIFPTSKLKLHNFKIVDYECSCKRPYIKCSSTYQMWITKSVIPKINVCSL